MLNNIDGGNSVRTILEENINKYFKYLLEIDMHSRTMPPANRFSYNWVPGRGKHNVTIPFTTRPTFISI
jgi:hypothetical protein